MADWQIVSLDAQTGYGYKTGQLEQTGAPKRDFTAAGANLAAELALGPTHNEDDDQTRKKRGLDVISVKFDSLVGRASDNYFRLILNFGADIHGDDTYENGVRFAWRGGVTLQRQMTSLKAGGQTETGDLWNVDIPVSLGLGSAHFLVSDRFDLGLQSASGHKIRNEAGVSWRPYVNFNNRYFPTVDLFVSHTFESGAVSNSVREKSNLVLVGLKLGIFQYTPSRNFEIKTAPGQFIIEPDRAE